VSFYLNDIITIRDVDWNYLAKYFSIPNPIRKIEFEKVKLINKNLLPTETDTIKIENKIGKTEMTDILNHKKILAI